MAFADMLEDWEKLRVTVEEEEETTVDVDRWAAEIIGRSTEAEQTRILKHKPCFLGPFLRSIKDGGMQLEVLRSMTAEVEAMGGERALVFGLHWISYHKTIPIHECFIIFPKNEI